MAIKMVVVISTLEENHSL